MARFANIVSKYAFTRNPLICSVPWPENPEVSKQGYYRVWMRDQIVYDGRFTPPFSVNLSDLADAAVPMLPDVPEGNEEPVCMLASADNEFQYRSFEVEFDYAGYSMVNDIYVFPGGVSHQAFSRLAELGEDIFSARFANYRGNVFWTTRTSGSLVSMRETALYPLYFLSTGGIVMTIRDAGSSNSVKYDLQEGIYAIDVAALRRRFVESYRSFPSAFVVEFNGYHAVRIVIREAMPATERYRIKFRNSFGVFEILEVTGSLNVSGEVEEKEPFKRYDRVTDSFVSGRERVSINEVFNIATGILDREEQKWIGDMITSDEVYLLDYGKLPVRVIPEIESYDFASDPVDPASYNLKLRSVLPKKSVMDELSAVDDSEWKRIFSDHFDNRFD